MQSEFEVILGCSYYTGQNIGKECISEKQNTVDQAVPSHFFKYSTSTSTHLALIH
jgi:hypothetical protein